MISEKPWYKSEGVIGSLTVITLSLLSLAGMNTAGLEAPITAIVLQGVTLAAGIVALRGRVKAQTRIKRGLK
jgi:hypothetical protein